MKAWVLHGINDLRFETVKKPEIAGGEVLVSVKAAGICGSDIPRIYRTGAHTHPLIPGHEFSGVVEECGKTVDQSLLGARVGIFPLIPCGKCEPCKKQRYEMCRNYSYLGSRRNGGFAEYVAVPTENLIRLPDNVTFEEAAMLEPMAVAVHAMRRTSFAGAETIVVCGLGTIGLLLLMFLLEEEQYASKKILVIGNKDFQRQTAVELGMAPDCYFDNRNGNAKEWLMEHTVGKGADVFFECVGRNETVTLAVDSAAPGGRIVLVGNPYSDMVLEKAVYWKLVRNQITVTGTWNSSFTHDSNDDWHYVLERLARRQIDPASLISHKFSLEHLDRGLKLMLDKSEDYVKVMGILPPNLS